MTLTSRTMEWLNQNRMRSYPMRRDEWRERVSPESGLDCVILDALVFDSDASGDEELEIVYVDVSPGGSSDSSGSSGAGGMTEVSMRYGGKAFSVFLSGGETSGPGSYDRRVISVDGNGTRRATATLVFSSHAYILDTVGEGHWDIGCRALRSRVVSLTDGFGVDGISVNGSSCVEEHSSASVVSGDVLLEDGFRTSPIIHRGRVYVRVGRRYGIDPCMHECAGEGASDCRSPLFFFCGQNAVNGGDIVLKGGRGVSVGQGREYTVRSGHLEGRSIPCVEIIAGSELLDIYRPTSTESPENT